MGKKIVTYENIWPVTIIKDRYQGAYSGAEYTAWNLEQNEIPEDVSGDDGDCMSFWRTPSYFEDNVKEPDIMVGKGNTPHLALVDLIQKLNK